MTLHFVCLYNIYVYSFREHIIVCFVLYTCIYIYTYVCLSHLSMWVLDIGVISKSPEPRPREDKRFKRGTY